MTIKERANNKIYAKVLHAGIHLEDLRRELKSGKYRGSITHNEMIGLVEGAKYERASIIKRRLEHIQRKIDNIL